MKFDEYTVGLLVRDPDRPPLDTSKEAEIQDAHMGYLARLHSDGLIGASGPLFGGDDSDFKELVLFRVPRDRAEELAEQDPAVRAGQLSYLCLPWAVPEGAVEFETVEFPRSMREADGLTSTLDRPYWKDEGPQGPPPS